MLVYYCIKVQNKPITRSSNCKQFSNSATIPSYLCGSTVAIGIILNFFFSHFIYSFLTSQFSPLLPPHKGPIWYMCLKIENFCLKTCVKIRVDEKVYENTYNVV